MFNFINQFLFMKKFIFSIISIILFYFSQSQTLQQLKLKRVHLPNGWSLTPVGKSLPLGDLPLNIAISSSKKYMAVTNNGQSIQSLQLIDVKTEKVIDNIEIPKSWLGLKFSANEKYLYASGGNDNRVLKYAVINNKLILKDSIQLGDKWPVKISPTGLDIDDARHLLYVVTKENNSLYVVDLNTKKITHQIQLSGEAYTCLLSPDKKELYITCWGCDKLIAFNTTENKIIDSINVGDNPNDECLSKNGQYLFVANGNDNSVSVIDIKKKKSFRNVECCLIS